MIYARHLGTGVLCAALLGGAGAKSTKRTDRAGKGMLRPRTPAKRRLGGIPSKTCLTAKQCEDQMDRVGAEEFHINNSQ